MPSAKPSCLLAFATFFGITGCNADPRDVLPWRNYHAASSAMEPTLPMGTRFVARSVAIEDLARGDIVILRKHDEDYVMRLVGLPGDRVALVNGRVVLNGKEVAQRAEPKRASVDGVGRRQGSVSTERFPGERRSHRILDTGPTPGDDMAEIKLLSGQFFVLGDNRDNAADSRYSSEVLGLGVIKGEQIRRRVRLA